MRILLITILLLGVTGAAFGATTNLPSVSRTDFVNALSAMNHGDTLIFPAGSALWSSAATVTKSVTIQGTGGATIITNSSGGENTWVLLLDTELDDPVRVTGIKFYGQGTASGIFVDRLQKNVRIDHCSFAEMRRHGIMCQGFEAYGVIDHCNFTNNYTAIEMLGNDGQSWDFSQSPFGVGTTNCVVIEDCYFENNDSTLVSDLNQVIYVSNAGRAVMRNCHVVGKTTVQSFSFWDSHGNNSQEPFDGNSLRGTVFAIIHSNVIDAAASSNFRHFSIRGGMHVFSDNIISGDVNASVFALTEEECWHTAAYPNQLTVWPAPDQMTNTWVVNNTYNGSPVTDSNITNSFGSHYVPNENDRTFIQLNRDYFITNSVANIPPMGTNHPTISGGVYGVDWLAYPHPLAGGGGGGSATSNRVGRVTAQTIQIR